MMYKKEELYLTTRNSIFYFVRRVPRDLIQYYSSNRISFSLKTKSKLKALRISSTIKQKLEDYWLGLRLQKLDIPQILIAKDKVNTERDHNPTLTQALDLYLKLKGQGRDKVSFVMLNEIYVMLLTFKVIDHYLYIPQRMLESFVIGY